jgi:hypothetical protein
MIPTSAHILLIISLTFLLILLGIYNIDGGIEKEIKSEEGRGLVRLPDIVIKSNYSFEQAGFHLHMKNQFELLKYNKHIDLSKSQIKVQWNMPADVLVDFYTLMRSNPNVLFRTSLPVDIEKATQHAQPFILYASLNADSFLSLDVEFNARYPQASEEQFRTFLIQQPIVSLEWDQNLENNPENLNSKALISPKLARSYRVEQVNSPFPLKVSVPIMPARKEYVFVTIGVHTFLTSLIIMLLITKK